MNLDELDKNGGELFRILDEFATRDKDDPEKELTGKFLKTLALLGIELVADHKRMAQQLENINKALATLVGIQAAGYQNGIIVKIANELEIAGQDSAEEKSGDQKEGAKTESYKDGESSYQEGPPKATINDSV